ncbi:MAG: class D sortase [Defluviitaleaceae bacterium]|nr:class D sortase [Defluviitaleaceae bacterium]
MRKRLIIIAGVILVAGGLVFAGYPWLKAYYFSRVQTNAMDMWLSQADNETPEPSAAPEPSVLVPASPSPSPAADSGQTQSVDLDQEDTNVSFDAQYVLDHMEGIITINKISLKAPILTGATADNLNISICSVTDTGKMGQTGNYVLAGHKSRVYGRQFNRLLEVTKGDTVVVENKRYIYSYVVTDVFSVTPGDTWVLDQVTDKKVITLITCDYRMNPIGRLIVKGELVSAVLRGANASQSITGS